MDKSTSEIEQLRDQLKQYQDIDPMEPEEGYSDSAVITNSSMNVDSGNLYIGNQSVSLPSYPNGSYTISGGTGNSVKYNTDLFNVNLQDPTDEIIKDMRNTVQDRILDLKKELEDLSNRYEDKEQELFSLVQKAKELKTCRDALDPNSDVEEIFEDIPF